MAVCVQYTGGVELDRAQAAAYTAIVRTVLGALERVVSTTHDESVLDTLFYSPTAQPDSSVPLNTVCGSIVPSDTSLRFLFGQEHAHAY